MDKRAFLKNMGLMGLAVPLSFSHLAETVAAVSELKPHDLATDEAFWLKVRADYDIKPDYINLENGYYCFMPRQTLEHQIEHMRNVNYEGSYYMRTVRVENKKKVANKVAEIVGCTAEEVAITRNATESLDLIIGGLPWEAGDEAVMAEQDYGAMLEHFR
ncbi:MAG: aminotransferase class V-fold PLP-dependent enzyme, partial [Woeseiales bacterium]